MNILFLGTPEFSVCSLERLAAMPGHRVVGAVTAPDKPVGRSLKMTPPPVKVAAERLGIPVFQPEKLNTAENYALFESLKVELLAVVAYGKIIGDTLLSKYRDRIINVHPSLLPKYRGVAPYQWALVNGETVTGVTIFYIAKELDAGDIILKRETPVLPDDNASTLHDRLAVMGAGMLSEAVDLIAAGNAPREPQDHSAATYFKKIDKSAGRIDWSLPAKRICDLVRGLCPWPSTFSGHGENLIKIHEAGVSEMKAPEGAAPGAVIKASEKEGLVIAAGDGNCVAVKKLQLASKSVQPVDSFLRGYKISSGDLLS